MTGDDSRFSGGLGHEPPAVLDAGLLLELRPVSYWIVTNHAFALGMVERVVQGTFSHSSEYWDASSSLSACWGALSLACRTRFADVCPRATSWETGQ